MEDGPVTIIIKAPNQQFADQTVQCEASWTIKRLKHYLSEEYPNKPKSEDQKLIYSGQLLTDSTVLKDILRTYEGQSTHTVHLVCSPKHTLTDNKLPTPSTIGNAGSSSQAAGFTAANASDGLRQRIPANTSNTATSFLGTAGQPAPIMTYEVQQQMILAQQYAMQNTMQQIYMQYLNQYMNSFSTNPNSPSTIPATTYGSPTNTTSHTGGDQMSTTAVPYMQQQQQQFYPHHLNNQHQHFVQSPIFQQQLQQQWLQQQQQHLLVNNGHQANQPSQTQQHLNAGQAPQPPVAGAGDAAAADGAAAPANAAAAVQRFPNVVQDEVENHDWLDLFYATSRLLVLVTLVYFYSSPLRCLIVIFFIVLYYLYHVGCFRQLQPAPAEANNNHLPAAAVPAPAVANNAAVAAQDAPVADQVAVGANAVDAAPDAADGAQQPEESLSNELVGQDPANHRTPVIALVRTFILSFFASLIPDTPAL